MFPGLFRRRDADSLRSRMAVEREEVRRSIRAQGSNGSDPDQPLWKKLLGVGRKRELMLAVVAALLVAGFTYERDGWNALSAAATMIGVALLARVVEKRRAREDEELSKPVLDLRDSDGDEYRARH